MHKRVISTLVVVLMALTMMAQERTDAQMMSIAKAKLARHTTAKKAKGNATQPLTLSTVSEGSQYRMFVADDGSGYVVVARNEAFKPIIGYSTEPATNLEIPCCMQACLDMINANLEERLKSAETEEATGKDGATYEEVSPMLTTFWQQGSPYNQKCPADYTGKTSVTGCVATAMAMVINYFKYPAAVSNKQGYYFYKTNSSGTASDTVFVNINSTYQWGKMLNTYSSSSAADAKEAVAQLMYDCGCAAGLTYGSGSTGGSTTTAARRFYEIFDYASVNHASKDYYSDWEWRQLVYDQLESGCPLMHSGQDPDNGGHAFVFDGIDADGLVHINWGWGKSTAAYFDMLALTPTTSSKTYNFEPTGFIYNLKAKDHLDEGEEQELQLVVGRGTSSYKNDYYTISLKENAETGKTRVIVNTCGVFNWTPVPARCYIGVHYESLDGGTDYDVRFKSAANNYYAPSEFLSRQGKSFGDITIDHDQTPDNIAPGRYKVSFVGYNDDRNNLKMRCYIRQRYKGLVYWILTVGEDGSLSLSDEIVVDGPDSLTPTGIKSITTMEHRSANSHTYNLNGQRVGNDYKGVVIQNGRKVVRR
ncbi:MAG: C10 family peptidase [Prevotella sp.]|nr:C10 family peptidase [Prevotella sp.]